MKQTLQAFAAHAEKHLPDCLMVVGAAAMSYGLYLVHPAGGWMLGGAFSIGGGVLLSQGNR